MLLTLVIWAALLRRVVVVPLATQPGFAVEDVPPAPHRTVTLGHTALLVARDSAIHFPSYWQSLLVWLPLHHCGCH
jgi:hypothetical protein